MSPDHALASCFGLGRQEPRRRRAGLAMGSGRKLRPLAGGFRVSCLHPRRLQPQDRRLVDGHASENGALRRRPADGDRKTNASSGARASLVYSSVVHLTVLR